MNRGNHEAATAWFASRGWTPFAFQHEVWDAYLNGESGLIHAATGMGKTLAAWIGPLLDAVRHTSSVSVRGASSVSVRGTSSVSSVMHETQDAPRTLTKHAPPLTVLWITPLRALVADTLEALVAPLRDLGLNWTIEARTGDMSPAARARQSRRLPTTLVTTPESLSMLLTRADCAEQLSSLRAVIVDEWHELLSSKRGVQVELALARIRALVPDVRVWGLSATIGNLEVARDALLGVGRAGRIVRGVETKAVVVDALIPPTIERFSWAGHLNTTLLPQVIAAIEEGETSIVFCNTRSQVEIWYQAIIAARPDWSGLVAVHHGSLDRKKRDWVENGLRSAKLRCVIATSSLDLGVDFSPVDRVLQIGSPKGIARLLQRAGRSGHRPGAVSRVTCVPTNALELLDVAAVRDGVESAKVEARSPQARPLDVLAQHLVTVGIGGGFAPDAMLAEVRGTHAYRDLSDDEWRWTLDFLTNGGQALKAYPDYAKLARDNGHFVVSTPEIARRHRMSIGTIVGDAQIKVAYMSGMVLGEVEESFIARLSQGDRFIFAGKPLEFVRVRDMKAWVRRAPSVQGAIPRWMGSRLPLSRLLAEMLRRRLGEASGGAFRDTEMEALRPLLETQAKWSAIPRADQVLVEKLKTRQGWHVFVYPFEGRLVHEGLAALFAYRMSRIMPISFSMSSNDYGFELLSVQEPPLELALNVHPERREGSTLREKILRRCAPQDDNPLFSPKNLEHDIPASLNAAEMARRQFREIARVAGLVFPGFPRAGKTARQLQASSGLFFDVFNRYDPGNLLLTQAQREVLERQLEHSRLGETLERLSTSEILLTHPPRATPLAFPLIVDTNRGRVSSEKLADRIKRMQIALEKAAG